MKSTGLLIAAALLAVLTGVLYWSNHHTAEDTAKPATPAASKLVTVKDADVSKIEIDKKGAEQVALEKGSDGKWEITAPQKLSADQEAVTGVISVVSGLNSERVVEDHAIDLKQYGLADPSVKLNLSTKDGKTQKLLLGDDTPTGNGVYAAVGGDPRVFTIASYAKSNLDKNASELRDKRLLTTNFDKVSQIDLIAKKQTVEFGRSKEAWQILKPRPLRADNFSVEDLVRRLKDAKMDLSASADADAKKITAAFSSATPIATVKVTDATGTQTLEVRKNKTDYYAKSTAVDGVYKVANDLGMGLDKALDDFRNKKLFDFGFDDVSAVDMHDGSKAYSLVKGGPDWWSNGKKMDGASVQAFIDKFRDLAATKFVDSGFTTATIQMKVTSNDGKRVENVSIAKSGDNYIAKREGEPSLYQLDPKAIEELQKSAADVKPAAEPPSPPATKK
ncbi:MAG TPA: DUF4340 domain-containing protein [Candidatus Sulfotelmatobacter sp.]|nr:DUF4340 domain-containing protein [Candidatus Sulfotelmatobacter sp.]